MEKKKGDVKNSPSLPEKITFKGDTEGEPPIPLQRRIEGPGVWSYHIAITQLGERKGGNAHPIETLGYMPNSVRIGRS